jgi:hypothetical protein
LRAHWRSAGFTRVLMRHNSPPLRYDFASFAATSVGSGAGCFARRVCKSPARCIIPGTWHSLRRNWVRFAKTHLSPLRRSSDRVAALCLQAACCSSLSTVALRAEHHQRASRQSCRVARRAVDRLLDALSVRGESSRDSNRLERSASRRETATEGKRAAAPGTAARRGQWGREVRNLMIESRPRF